MMNKGYPVQKLPALNGNDDRALKTVGAPAKIVGAPAKLIDAPTKLIAAPTKKPAVFAIFFPPPLNFLIRTII